MGVITGLHVYGYRKPTISAQLVEGGSLSPNTTYYIIGTMKVAAATYNAIGSEMSNLVQITTTTTALSIQLSHQTFRSITAFSDNGDNRTLITCPRHCLGDGVMSRDIDQFKIDTGSYTGTWSVDEWVNYDQFIIDTPYIDNIPVDCYTDSQYYNRPIGIDMNYTAYNGVSYLIRTVSPFKADGSFVNANNWTDAAYQGTHVANPTLITSQPTSRMYGGNAQTTMIDTGIYSIFRDWGSILLAVAGVSVSPGNIYDEVQSSGFIYNCSYQSSGSGYGNNKHMTFYGAIMLDNGGLYNQSNMIMVMLSGEFHSKQGQGYITMNSSAVITYPGSFTTYSTMELNASLLWNAAPSNGLGGHVSGDGVYIWGAPRFGNSTGDYQEEIRNIITDVIADFGVIENKIYLRSDDAQLAQISYGGPIFRNCTFYQFLYWVAQTGTEGQEFDKYNMENVVFKPSTQYIIRAYSYSPTTLGVYKFLNINTNTVNNEKRCIRNNNNTMRFEFWRRAEFTVQFQGTPIEGASITITDGFGNEYSGLTDVDGRLDIDVIEQITAWAGDDGPGYYDYDPAYQTDYGNYTIEINHHNYSPEAMFFDTLYENEIIKVSLASSVYASPAPDVVIDEEPTTIAIIETETE